MKEKSIFTVDFIKDIVADFFNGNRDSAKPYVNENSEDIDLYDAETGETKRIDLASYLNIDFYSWQNKVEESQDDPIDNIQAWLNSINYSMNKGYARVSVMDEKCTASKDIDNGEITGNIEFLIQLDKLSNLDYYLRKIRNRYMGEPIEIMNYFGKKVKAYVLFGTVDAEEEPFNCQLGYCVIVNCGFKMNYMESALDYTDYKIEFSLDEGRHFYEIPLTQQTWKLISENESVSKAYRPDRTGFIVTTFAATKTFSFFDYNRKFNEELNDLLFTMPAIYKNNVPTKLDKNLQHSLVIRLITSNKDVYDFYEIIDSIEKTISNGDFNICSLVVKSSAKQQLLGNRYYFLYFRDNVYKEMSRVPIDIDHMLYSGIKEGEYQDFMGGKITLDTATSISDKSTDRLFLYIDPAATCDIQFKRRVQIGTSLEFVSEKVFHLEGDKLNIVEFPMDYKKEEYDFYETVYPKGTEIIYDIKARILKKETPNDKITMDVIANTQTTSCLETYF